MRQCNILYVLLLLFKIVFFVFVIEKKWQYGELVTLLIHKHLPLLSQQKSGVPCVLMFWGFVMALFSAINFCHLVWIAGTFQYDKLVVFVT